MLTAELELSSDCSCVYFDEEENESQSPECFGCYQDELAYLGEEISKWADANGFNHETLVRINASSVGWRRSSGYIDTTVFKIPESLVIDGDFRIVFRISDDYKTLTAQRYSHDEPTGTGVMTFGKSPEDDSE